MKHFVPKYYLKRKLKNGEVALIPVVADPPDKKTDEIGLKKYQALRAGLSKKLSMAGE